MVILKKADHIRLLTYECSLICEHCVRHLTLVRESSIYLPFLWFLQIWLWQPKSELYRYFSVDICSLAFCGELSAIVRVEGVEWVEFCLSRETRLEHFDFETWSLYSFHVLWDIDNACYRKSTSFGRRLMYVFE